MENLVIKISRDDKYGYVVSSRIIAEQLNKQHKHVLESLDNLKNSSTADISALLIPSEYIASNGKTNREYLLTKDGFILYMFNIQGYNEFKMAYINRFNELEKQVREMQPQIPQDYPSALRALADKYEENRRLEIENQEMKPKALFADAVTSSDTLILVGELAKLICQNGVNIGANRLWTWLRDNGYIFKNSREPTQKGMELKLFEVIERTIQRGNQKPKVTRTTKVTGKGQQYFINKFLNN